MKKFLLTFALILLSLTASAASQIRISVYRRRYGHGPCDGCRDLQPARARQPRQHPDDAVSRVVVCADLLRQQLDNRLSGGWNGSCHRH